MAVVAGLLCAPLILSGCKEQNKYAAPPPAKVTVATPTRSPITLYAEFTGNTAPVASVDLEARVQGFLQSIDYRDGEAVKKDRVLFKIEQTQYQAQVDLQQAQLDAAKAKQINAQREFDRQSVLGQKEVATQRNVDDAQTNLAAANAQVAASEASLKLAKTSLAYATVSAPFDGVVTRRLANAGALVGSAGPTKLATILQVDPLYVYFNITEQQQINLRDALAKKGKTLKDMREEGLELPVQVALSSDTDVPLRRQDQLHRAAGRTRAPGRCRCAANSRTRTSRWCRACSSGSVLRSARSTTRCWSTTPR